MTTEEALAEVERMKAEYRAAVKTKEKADRESKKKRDADELQLLKDAFNSFLIREGLEWLAQWVTGYLMAFGASVKIKVPGHGTISAYFERLEDRYVPRSDVPGPAGVTDFHTWHSETLAKALACAEVPKEIEE